MNSPSPQAYIRPGARLRILQHTTDPAEEGTIRTILRVYPTHLVYASTRRGLAGETLVMGWPTAARITGPATIECDLVRENAPAGTMRFLILPCEDS